MAHRPYLPPPLDPNHPAPPRSRVRARAITATTALGLITGVAWTLLTVPKTRCGADDLYCELQLLHAAQLTKVAGATMFGYLLGCGLTYRLRHDRVSRRRHGSAGVEPMTSEAARTAMRSRPRAPH